MKLVSSAFGQQINISDILVIPQQSFYLRFSIEKPDDSSILWVFFSHSDKSLTMACINSRRPSGSVSTFWVYECNITNFS